MAPAANIQIKEYAPNPEHNATNNADHCDKQ